MFRSAGRDHIHESDSAGGRILGIIARTLPREVDVIARTGIEDDPVTTTREELISAIPAVLKRIVSYPALLFAFATSFEAHGNEPPAGRSFTGGSGISGIRLPGASSNLVYALRCGPGQCELVETSIGADGRGTNLRTLDLREEQQIQTVNLDRIRIHRKRIKTKLPDELQRLLQAAQTWPPGEVAKFVPGLRD
jgi:hypothetical protein